MDYQFFGDGMTNTKSHLICAKHPEKVLWRYDVSSAKLPSILWLIAMVVVSLTFYLVEGPSWMRVILWAIIWTSVLGWSAFFIVLIYLKVLRFRRKIYYDRVNKKVVIMRKRNRKTVLEVNMKDIQEIITSPYEDDPTLIVSDTQITPWTGISLSLQYAGGEFGQILGEEFKKYWENKGYNVSVKKRKSWLLGERIVYERGGIINEKF